MSKRACKFKTGKPGYGCKDGKLYRFERKSVLVLAPWPEPQAWFKSHRKAWHSSRKRADKVFSAALYAKDDVDKDIAALVGGAEEQVAWDGDPAHPCAEEVAQFVRCYGREPRLPADIIARRQRTEARRIKREEIGRIVQYVRHLQAPYFDAIPEEVRNELLRYWNRRWHLFCLFARCPGALDLSRSNPALCYALASHWAFHKPVVKWPMRAARALIVKKQKHILDWLGFPGTETARRIMAKVEPVVLDMKRLLRFRCTFADAEIVKWLSHLERINPSVMGMVCWPNHRPYLSARLLCDASREGADVGRGASAIRMFGDTLQMRREMPDVPCPRPFVSLRQLEAVHDDFSLRREREWQRNQLGGAGRYGEPLAFPAPPFQGTDNILPLMSPDELHAEGREMGHCVGIYDERVARGRCFIYRVNAPVRATMEILSRDGRGWVPGQLSQARNKPVPAKIAIQLFHELFSSGKNVPEEEVEMMDADWTPEQAEEDRQLRLFDLDPQGELAPL